MDALLWEPASRDPASETGYASFDAEWRPESYLATYYTEVEEDERATLRFLVESADRLPEVPVLLEFGCGPTVHHLFPFATRAGEIHVADYLPSNLDAVHRWVAGREGAHDWSAFAEHTLRCRSGSTPSRGEVLALERTTQRAITQYLRADARNEQPLLDPVARPTYPAVVCCFCPDSITDDLGEWRRCVANVASLVEPGGWFVLAALGAASSYMVGTLRFPSAGVHEGDVVDVLAAAGFDRAATTVTVEATTASRHHGYGSVILASGRRT